LTQFVGTHQNSFISGRNIANNIRLLSDVIDLADDQNVRGSVLALDIFKNFASLHWDFVFIIKKKWFLPQFHLMCKSFVC